MGNRVIREFGPRHAMRAVFRDEDGRRLAHGALDRGPSAAAAAAEGSADNQPASMLLDRLVEAVLLDGVRAGGRHFRFLAWSNSQMRDHGCYLFSLVTKAGCEKKIGDIRE